jgi:tRNA threonylcarbamoyladenosine biosynthesis protein TsaE
VIVDLPDLDAVAGFGSRIADALIPGDVVALSGDLGAGKTTLARAIIGGLGYVGEVPSPTFTIVETYDSPGARLPLVHADFYRIERPAEADEIGIDDYREGAALIAEWPENVGGFSHEPQCLSIRLEFADEGRKAVVDPGKEWVDRLP